MNQLGHFEQELLTELRQVVAERATVPEPRRALPRKRIALATAGGGLLAAGLLVGLPALDADQASAAYAVVGNPDGTVTVRVERLEDADGLERQLAAHGIPAAIDYVPAGMVCANEVRRYQVDLAEDWPQTAITWEPSGAFSLTVDPADLQGGTLVMVHSGDVDGTSAEKTVSALAVFTAVAIGPVAPCELVDLAEPE